MKEKKYAILVLSCDKYADLWKPFFSLFKKNWPDCPYPVYLETNDRKFRLKGISSLPCGKDINWSQSLKKTLEKIPQEYLAIVMDDTFLNKRVKTKLITNAFQFLKENNGNHMHFHPWPKPAKSIKRVFGTYEKNMPYRVNVLGLWKKEYLVNLLIDGENPWNFEIFGSYRSSYDEGFFCSKIPLISYTHVVEKGKWLPKALLYCKENNIPIEVKKRKQLDTTSAVISYFSDVYFKYVYTLNWEKRLWLMNLMRKLVISY